MLRGTGPYSAMDMWYEAYQTHIEKTVDAIFAELNKIAKSTLGVELSRPEVVYLPHPPDPSIFAAYDTKTNSILVFNETTLVKFVNENSRPSASPFYPEPDGRSGASLKVDEVIGHELGHALIFNGYLLPQHTPSPLLNKTDKFMQIGEAAAQVLGTYISRMVAGEPSDPKSVAIRIIDYIAEASRLNALAIKEYMQEAKELVAQHGYSLKAVSHFMSHIIPTTQTNQHVTTDYNLPQLALAEALLASGATDIPEFLKQMFKAPDSFQSIRQFFKTDGLTDVMVKGYIDAKQKEIAAMKASYEEYKRQEAVEDSALKGTVFKMPDENTVSHSVEVLMRAKYEATMDAAKKLVESFEDTASKAESVLAQYGLKARDTTLPPARSDMAPYLEG